MSRINAFLAALLAVFLCGCLQVTDELAIQPDGSGTVKMEVKSSMPGGLGSMSQGMGGGNVMYPPTSEDEAKKFFSGQDITVTAKEESAENGGSKLNITVSFKDINALLNSPYGRAHALTLKIENGALKFKALTGMEIIARMVDAQANSSEMQAQMAMMGGAADAQKKSGPMKDDFRITLPNAVTASNGKQDGKTVAWTADHASITNGAEFADQLGKVLEASCPADGLKMSPVTPPRLALTPFKDLAAGAVAASGPALDTNKIINAAKFVPYALHVSRTLDLSGTGGGGMGSSAELIGAIVIPHELAPQKWGAARVDEVTDPKGNSLKMKENRFEFGGMRYGSRVTDGGDDSDSDKPDASNAAEDRHPVTLAFMPPDWKTKEIARIKGAVSLQYYGGMQVVKVANAIPGAWIMSQEKMMSGGGMGVNGAISDPALTSLGLVLTCQMGMVQSGMTTISLNVKGGKADVTEVQVFDADGKPWPTTMQNTDMGENSLLQLMVAGEPKGTLSLALVVSGSGSTVEIPISAEHVPVGGK